MLARKKTSQLFSTFNVTLKVVENDLPDIRIRPTYHKIITFYGCQFYFANKSPAQSVDTQHLTPAELQKVIVLIRQ